MRLPRAPGVAGRLTPPQRESRERIRSSQQHVLGINLLSNAVKFTASGGRIVVPVGSTFTFTLPVART